MDTPRVVVCPHCSGSIIVEVLACGIFRHGVNKKNMTPINPHAKEEECKSLFEKDLIYGCGKPFQVSKDYVVTKCEYI